MPKIYEITEGERLKKQWIVKSTDWKSAAAKIRHLHPETMRTNLFVTPMVWNDDDELVADRSLWNLSKAGC